MGTLFRRYRTWNPVHPTAGAFWGIGVGLGCGVGWGPGFGPEAVGFVGGGCGVGFSIGVTFIGVGVGLPTSGGVISLPLNTLVFTAKGAANTTSIVVVPAVVSAAQQCWQALSSVTDINPHPKSFDGIPIRKDLVGQEKDGILKDDRNGVSSSSLRPQQETALGTPPRKAAVLPRRQGNFGLVPRDLVMNVKPRR